MTPIRVRHALKEWACVVEALREGRQTLLLRKGGIDEPHGEFKAAHPEFLLAPAWEHQKSELLKPAEAVRYGQCLRPPSTPLSISFDTFARLESVVVLDDPRRAFRLAEEHIWTEEYVRMRVDYKPEKPLFVLLLRVFALERPVKMPWTERYAGCRSWVELEEVAEALPSWPALDDAAHAMALQRARSVLEG